MFSGIVEHLRFATKFDKKSNDLRITLPVPKNWNLKVGESVNVNGVCSTVESIKDHQFTIFYMMETLRRTNLGEISQKSGFNLERSLTLNSLIGGHLVSGHIDVTATVSKIKKEGGSKVLAFKIDPKFTRYIIYKGSIAVNGVSLTIVTVTKNSFIVSLIPYTLTHTNLGDLKVGDKVNVELDLLAKYIEKLIKPHK